MTTAQRTKDLVAQPANLGDQAASASVTHLASDQSPRCVLTASRN
ncbi:MAG: hypothetical protein ACLQUY_10290 [Ktedonobacterales bacterium]